MSTQYKITIEKIETVTVTERGDFTVIDRVPWDQQGLDRFAAYGGSQAAALKDEPLREVRGYAPDREVQKLERTTVYEQTVPEQHFNLAGIVVAVNGL